MSVPDAFFPTADGWSWVLGAASATRRRSQSPDLLGVDLLRDLPDEAAGVAEAGGADAPRAIHRPVEELHSPRPKGLAHRVDIVHRDREHGPSSIRRGPDGRRGDELVCVA